MKDPPSFTCPAKVAIFDPTREFRVVSLSDPLPQTLEDCPIYVTKGTLGDDVLVVVGPAVNQQIEQLNVRNTQPTR